MLRFTWDIAKARSNFRKHGVSFEEAKSVFFDEFALQFYDEDSEDEDRFLLLGVSDHFRMLIVVYCERGECSEELRIISARKPTQSERRHYQGDAR